MATENYTTYDADTDPNERFTVAAAKITITGLLNNEDAYVYADKGASHFGPTFTHDLETKTTASVSGKFIAWAVTNFIDDFNGGCWAGAGTGLGVFYEQGTKLWLLNGDGNLSDSWASATLGTLYYITVERTSETAVVERIYTDAARTVLADTLAVSVTNGQRFQYVYGAQSWNSGTDSSVSGYVENLDLNEAAAGHVPYNLILQGAA